MIGADDPVWTAAAEGDGTATGGADVTPRRDERIDVGRFAFERGGEVPALRLATATYGDPDAPAVLVCHPLTASHRPAGGDGPFDGWWSAVVGPGRPIDTTTAHVVCVGVPGSPHGSSAPPREGPDGEPWGSAFPMVTVGDWTRAQRRVADRLGIDRFAAVVGGSVGGMNALEWARRSPERVDRVAAVATGPRLDPQCLALDAVARRAITNDPAWQHGDYHATDRAPTHGLAQARRIGHVMYRSKPSMRREFGRRPAAAVLDGLDGNGATDAAGSTDGTDATDDTEAAGSTDDTDSADDTGGTSDTDAAGETDPMDERTATDDGDDPGDATGGAVTGGLPTGVPERAAGPGTYRAVESYLDYNAERFARRFDAASYHQLLRAMDEYELASRGSLTDALAAFDGELLVVSYTGDWHFTVEQARRLADAASEAGVTTRHRRIESDYGHDAFLVADDGLHAALRSLLADERARRSRRFGPRSV